MTSGPTGSFEPPDAPPFVVVGQTGDQGDIGKQGDIGHTGRQGEQGIEGRQGTDGPTGIQGQPGSNAVFSTGRVLALFGFVVAVFLLLAYRSEINANNIRESNLRNARQVYALCQVGHDNARSLGAVLDQILVGVKRRDDLTPALKAETIRVYKNAKPRAVNCGAKP